MHGWPTRRLRVPGLIFELIRNITSIRKSVFYEIAQSVTEESDGKRRDVGATDKAAIYLVKVQPYQLLARYGVTSCIVNKCV